MFAISDLTGYNGEIALMRDGDDDGALSRCVLGGGSAATGDTHGGSTAEQHCNTTENGPKPAGRLTAPHLL